jgi:hypothetical protein
MLFTKSSVRIQILRLNGPDKVGFTFKGHSPFPNLSQLEREPLPPCLYQDVQRGYAEEWLSKMGFSGEVVDLITYEGLQRVEIP